MHISSLFHFVYIQLLQSLIINEKNNFYHCQLFGTGVHVFEAENEAGTRAGDVRYFHSDFENIEGKINEIMYLIFKIFYEWMQRFADDFSNNL